MYFNCLIFIVFTSVQDKVYKCKPLIFIDRALKHFTNNNLQIFVLYLGDFCQRIYPLACPQARLLRY
jgi:hypothetical protein